MVERLQPRNKQREGLYFNKPSPDLSFTSSGCVLLDCVVGGGWPLGRMVNIIGDKSTGKTLLAIEAFANFASEYPRGLMWYREAESAFDKGYAEALGMPIDRINPGEKKWRKFDTIEDVFEDLEAQIEKANRKGVPGIYCIDSLDALSDREEMKRKIDEDSYGTGKPKKLGELFRKKVRAIEESQILVIIISQVRANIGVKFGEKTRRSGGKAMDFYASQVVKLAHMKNLVATIRGVKRATGIRIKAKCTKNKIGLPLRECEFVIRFGYGVEDYEAGLQWLIEVGRTKALGWTKKEAEEALDASATWDDDTYTARKQDLDNIVKTIWREIETDFLPTRRKYRNGRG